MAESEIKASAFLPMELDISWAEDNILSLPPSEKSQRLSMSSIDVDFKQLAHRTENTSTPFVPRLTMCKSPTAMLHLSDISDDSGYDAEMSMVLTSSSLTIPSNYYGIPQCGFIPIPSVRHHRNRLSMDSDVLQEDDACQDCELETDSAYDETSSLSSVHSQVLSDISSPASSCDSQAMDMVFQALDLNSSGYSSIDSSRYCSQQDLEFVADDTAVMSSESESSQDSQVSVVQMVCVKLEKALPMFSTAISDRLIGRKMGLVTVNVIGELHARNMVTPLNIIFSNLSAADLASVSCVSRAWRESMMDDSQAKKKWQEYIRHQRVLQFTEKENRFVKSKADCGVVTRKDKGVLAETQFVGTCTDSLSSTNHGSYTRFVQEAAKLTNEESLRKCPQCQHPARVHSIQERAQCSNAKCENDFCLKCLGTYHGSKDCPSMIKSGSGVKCKKSRTDSKIGSKKSKRNLQRL